MLLSSNLKEADSLITQVFSDSKNIERFSSNGPTKFTRYNKQTKNSQTTNAYPEKHLKLDLLLHFSR